MKILYISQHRPCPTLFPDGDFGLDGLICHGSSALTNSAVLDSKPWDSIVQSLQNAMPFSISKDVYAKQRIFNSQSRDYVRFLLVY